MLVPMRPIFWFVIGAAAVAMAGVTIALVFTVVSFVRDPFGTEIEVTPGLISSLSYMEVPDEATLESGAFDQWQDWSLTATVVIPVEHLAAWEATLGAYPEPTVEACAELGLAGGDGQVCAGTQDGPDVAKFARTDLEDGSVRVAITAFGD